MQDIIMADISDRNFNAPKKDIILQNLKFKKYGITYILQNTE